MPPYIFGKVQIAATADLGSLGNVQETIVANISLWPNLLQLFPWLVLGAMLLLAPNRRRAAWIGLLPALILFAGLLIAESAGFSSSLIMQLLLPLQAVLFGVSIVWLLPWEDRRRSLLRSLGRAYGALLLGSALFMTILLGPNPAANNQSWMGAAVIVSGLLLGFIAVGTLTRRRLCRTRFAAWLLPASFLSGLASFMVLVLVVQIMTGFTQDMSRMVGQMVVMSAILGLIYWILLLPYVFIAFGSAFYRRRLQAAFRVEAREDGAAPPCGAECAEIEAAKAQG